jgi:hypothetical protein
MQQHSSGVCLDASGTFYPACQWDPVSTQLASAWKRVIMIMIIIIILTMIIIVVVVVVLVLVLVHVITTIIVIIVVIIIIIINIASGIRCHYVTVYPSLSQFNPVYQLGKKT